MLKTKSIFCKNNTLIFPQVTFLWPAYCTCSKARSFTERYNKLTPNKTNHVPKRKSTCKYKGIPQCVISKPWFKVGPRDDVVR